MKYKNAIEELINCNSFFHYKIFNEAIKMHHGELAILNYLYSINEHQTPSSISHAMSVSTPRITVSLKSLEKKGLIEKFPSKTDRRKTYICITKQGINSLEKQKKEIENNFLEMFKFLGKHDTDEFLHIVQRLESFHLDMGKQK